MFNFIKRNPIVFYLTLFWIFLVGLIFTHIIYISISPTYRKELYQQSYQSFMSSFIKDADNFNLPYGAIRSSELTANPVTAKHYLVYGYAVCYPDYGDKLKGFCSLLYPKELKDVHPGKESINIKFDESEQNKNFEKCIMTHDQFYNWIPQKSCMVLLDGQVKEDDKKEKYFEVKHVIQT